MTLELNPTQRNALRDCVGHQLRRHLDLARLMASEGREEPGQNKRARLFLAQVLENLDNNGHGNDLSTL